MGPSVTFHCVYHQHRNSVELVHCWETIKQGAKTVFFAKRRTSFFIGLSFCKTSSKFSLFSVDKNANCLPDWRYFTYDCQHWLIVTDSLVLPYCAFTATWRSRNLLTSTVWFVSGQDGLIVTILSVAEHVMIKAFSCVLASADVRQWWNVAEYFYSVTVFKGNFKLYRTWIFPFSATLKVDFASPGPKYFNLPIFIY